MPPHPWDTAAFMRMTDVTPRGGCLIVRFGDGYTGEVRPERLLPSGSAVDVNWQRMTWNAYEITVPVADHTETIPWSTVRLLADPAYSAYVQANADREARRVGRRISALRRARGLARATLADHAGIALADLERIERGGADGYHGVAAVLAAMGCTLADLSRRATRPPPDEATASLHATPA